MNAARMLAIVAIGIATGLAGCGGSDGSSGGAENQAPVASFVAAPDNGPAPLQVQFDASASADTDGSLLSYRWTFGDNSPVATGMNVSHTFPVVGAYTVTLTVTDDKGAAVSATRQITVAEPPPANVAVPDVVGATQAAAVIAVERVGLRVGNIGHAADSLVAAGSVISQTPPGGTSVGRGSTVDLVISSGTAGPGPGQISLIVEPDTMTIPQGARALVAVELARGLDVVGEISTVLNSPPETVLGGTLIFADAMTTGFLPIHVAPDAPLGESSLDVQATGGGASSQVSVRLRVVRHLPSSQYLIQSARMAGRLDYETSLVYRAYALFGDERLPVEYYGSGSVAEDNLLFLEMHKSWATFSPETQGLLRPFLMRPADPGSAWNPTTAVTPSNKTGMRTLRSATGIGQSCTDSQSWVSVLSEAAPVRVWVRCSGNSREDSEVPFILSEALSILDNIFNEMTEIGGWPIPDVGGLDDAIDLYIVDPLTRIADRKNRLGSAYGVTEVDVDSISPSSNQASDYVLVRRELARTAHFQSVIAHEFFHVLEDTHNRTLVRESGLKDKQGRPVWETYWLVEAAASWAEAYIDRVKPPKYGRAAGDTVHRPYFTWTFQSRWRSDLPLNYSGQGTGAGDLTGDVRRELIPYSAYIWPYFVEQQKGTGKFMKSIWVDLEKVQDFEQADTAVDRQYSFAENFKTFALRNLNKSFGPEDPLPYNKRYKKLDEDQFPDGPSMPMGFASLAVDIDTELEIVRPNLTAQYLEVTLLDNYQNKVEFDFSGIQPSGLLDVLALVKNGNPDGSGTWVDQPLDFSEAKTVTFCFDRGPTTIATRGKFKTIVLVLANHSQVPHDVVRGTLVIKPRSAMCETTGWTGVVKRVLTVGATDRSSESVWASEADISLKYIRLDGPDPFSGQWVRVFDLREGGYRLDVVGHKSDFYTYCTYHYYAHGAMVPEANDDVIVNNSTEASLFVAYLEREPVEYVGGALTHRFPLKIEETCSDGTGRNELRDSAWIWWDMYAEWQPFPKDGRNLQGSYDLDRSTAEGVYKDHYEWSLSEVRE